jgi:hypothetical protein
MGRRIILDRFFRSSLFPGTGGEQNEETSCQQSVPNRPPNPPARDARVGWENHFPHQERLTDPHGAFFTGLRRETEANIVFTLLANTV